MTAYAHARAGEIPVMAADLSNTRPESCFLLMGNLREFPGRFENRRTFVHFGAETLNLHGIEAKAPRRTCR
jgi:hypothetical protein